MIEVKKQSDLKVGDRVHYQPKHYDAGTFENGIVKSIPDHTTMMVRVVYNCGGEWDRFAEFTSAMTDIRDLFHDWR